MIQSARISEETALEQVLRFEHYQGFPIAGSDGQMELVRAWRLASRDEAHAREIGDELIQRLKFCPTPADVHETAIRLRVNAEMPEWHGFDPNCQICGDTGWTVNERGAVRCKCVPVEVVAKAGGRS